MGYLPPPPTYPQIGAEVYAHRRTNKFYLFLAKTHVITRKITITTINTTIIIQLPTTDPTANAD